MAFNPGMAAASFPPPQAGERILVLSPHPDDESLCCGGYIAAAERAGAQVYIVWATTGDGYWRAVAEANGSLAPDQAAYRRLGLRRMREARKAAMTLGVPSEHLYFLGFPDGGLGELYDQFYLRPYRSPHSGLAAAAYPGVFEPGAPYTGAELVSLLTRLVKQIRPDRIFLPAIEDRHGDHKALALFGAAAAMRSGYGARMCRWIVHSGWSWPSPMGYDGDGWLSDPPTGMAYVWQSYELNDWQKELKLEAILAYHSQLAVMKDFLLAFVRRNELFSCVSSH